MRNDRDLQCIERSWWTLAAKAIEKFQSLGTPIQKEFTHAIQEKK